MEGKVIEELKNKFTPQIRNRGIAYYNEGKVLKCFKTTEGYISKVRGSYGNEYVVKIINNEDGYSMSCNCPYTENCKHEYSTIIAIANKKFKEIELLTEEDAEDSFAEVLKAIPSEELKNYLISKAETEELDYVDEEDIRTFFYKYIPKISKYGVYSRLYNRFLIEGYEIDVLEKQFETIRKNIEVKDFHYVFVLVTAIIDAICESKVEISSELLIDIYMKLGMFIRIAYRKGNEETKQDIEIWRKKYLDTDSNGDVYLEDMLLSIK